MRVVEIFEEQMREKILRSNAADHLKEESAINRICERYFSLRSSNDDTSVYYDCFYDCNGIDGDGVLFDINGFDPIHLHAMTEEELFKKLVDIGEVLSDVEEAVEFMTMMAYFSVYDYNGSLWVFNSDMWENE